MTHVPDVQCRTEVVNVRRSVLLSLVMVVALASVAMAQCWCEPFTPDVPRCYTTVYPGQTVEIGIRFPVCFPVPFCCCPPPAPQVLMWRVETWEGQVVYSQTLLNPVSVTSFSASWDLRDAEGIQVAPGYYRVIVVTTEGDYDNNLRLVEQRPCFWPLTFNWPCFSRLCAPEVTLRAVTPRCCPPRPVCWPCCP